jgi:hypothetical protein
MDWNWDNLKQRLMSGWDLMRVLRLVMSFIILIESIIMHEYFITALGGFMLFQALSNTGCCAGGACYSDPIQKKERMEEEVVYEEIKNK